MNALRQSNLEACMADLEQEEAMSLAADFIAATNAMAEYQAVATPARKRFEVAQMDGDSEEAEKWRDQADLDAMRWWDIRQEQKKAAHELLSALGIDPADFRRVLQ